MSTFIKRIAGLAVAGATSISLVTLSTPAAHADIVSCDTLKKQLDTSGTTGAGIQLSPYGQPGGASTAIALKYLASYALAHAQKCEFLNVPENPYHEYGAEPGEKGIGHSFALQTDAYSNKCAGVIVEVQRGGFLNGAGNNVGSCKNDDRELPKSYFAYVATGAKVDGLWAYKLMVTDGPHYGKCVEISDKPHAGQPTARVAEKCDKVNTYFASRYHSGGWVWSPKGYYMEAYQLHGSDFKYKGTLTVEYNQPDGVVTFRPQDYHHPKEEQHFHYRPEGLRV
ncbi:hypothetical protein [Streptomyces sp. NPDC052042]|uniref:hypothetical protein n=1 Tax=Streptomyces sp. NPDC052042 TaxID=3365683 RepID=UPI0037D7919B